MKDQDVTALFEKWNQAIQTGEPATVTALYADNAVLIPTVSNQVRHNHAEIEEYFVAFLQKGPAATLTEQNIRIFDDLAMNCGVYSFSFNDGSTVVARFSYVYQLIDDEWKIIHHHSSAMPEG